MNSKKVTQERVSNVLAENVDVPSRTIFLFNAIDDDSARHFIIALRLLDTTPGTITVVLSSAGGYDAAGWAIFDAIRNSKNPVRIEGYGHVQSMAALVLQAGDVRLLAPSCRFMVHVGSLANLGEEIEIKRLEALVIEARVGIELYIHTLALSTGRPVAHIRKEVEAETFLDSALAVHLGYADGILSPDAAPPLRK